MLIVTYQEKQTIVTILHKTRYQFPNVITVLVLE